jgi:hypothetical protein
VVTFEKQKLFTSIGETSRNRRTDKRLKDLEDILAAVTRKDAAGDKIPKFVSINMSNLNGSATTNQVLRAVNSFKTSFVMTGFLHSALSQLKHEILGSKDSRQNDVPTNETTPWSLFDSMTESANRNNSVTASLPISQTHL